MDHQTKLSPKALIEGILFAAGHPVKAELIASLLEIEESEVKDLIGELQESYAAEERGFWLSMVNGGYQLRTKPELKAYMAKLYEKKPPRLTQAMLEVLAIVAYKQPITRPELDRIRGVDSTAPLKSVLERELVEMRGRSDAVGNPVLYATTPKFLEWFQIHALGDLPPLSEIEALDVVADEGPDNLMGLLNKDDGFSAEDLKDVDDTLQDVNRSQRNIALDPETIEKALNPEAAKSKEASTETPEVAQAASSDSATSSDSSTTSTL